MADFDNYAKLIQLERQGQQDDLGTFERGVRGLSGGVASHIAQSRQMQQQHAERNRPLAAPLQKFMNAAMSGRMSPRQAGMLAKMVQSGMMSEEQADAVLAGAGGMGGQAQPQMPEGPGNSPIPTNISLGGLTPKDGPAPPLSGPEVKAPPDMAAIDAASAPMKSPMPAYNVGKTIHERVGLGGVASPGVEHRFQQPQTAAPVSGGGMGLQAQAPQMQPQSEPESFNHTWTAQDLHDAQGAMSAFPQREPRKSEADYMLELVKEQGRNSRTGLVEQGKGERLGRVEQMKLKLQERQFMDNVRKDEEAMKRVLAGLEQSNTNSVRASGTAEYLKYLDTQERALQALETNQTRLLDSENLFFDRPELLNELEKNEAMLTEARAKLEELRVQAKTRAMGPDKKNVSATSTEKRPSRGPAKTINGETRYYENGKWVP